MCATIVQLLEFYRRFVTHSRLLFWKCFIVSFFLQPTQSSQATFGRSFIVAAYVKWLEGAGARVMPLRFTDPLDSLRLLMREQLSGLLLQGFSRAQQSLSSSHSSFFLILLFVLGGGANITDWSIPGSFASVSRALLSEAISLSNQGHHFPVWGTCQGRCVYVPWTSLPLLSFHLSSVSLSHGDIHFSVPLLCLSLLFDVCSVEIAVSLVSVHLVFFSLIVAVLFQFIRFSADVDLSLSGDDRLLKAYPLWRSMVPLSLTSAALSPFSRLFARAHPSLLQQMQSQPFSANYHNWSAFRVLAGVFSCLLFATSYCCGQFLPLGSCDQIIQTAETKPTLLPSSFPFPLLLIFHFRSLSFFLFSSSSEEWVVIKSSRIRLSALPSPHFSLSFLFSLDHASFSILLSLFFFFHSLFWQGSESSSVGVESVSLFCDHHPCNQHRCEWLVLHFSFWTQDSAFLCCPVSSGLLNRIDLPSSSFCAASFLICFSPLFAVALFPALLLCLFDWLLAHLLHLPTRSSCFVCFSGEEHLWMGHSRSFWWWGTQWHNDWVEQFLCECICWGNSAQHTSLHSASITADSFHFTCVCTSYPWVEVTQWTDLVLFVTDTQSQNEFAVSALMIHQCSLFF